jgi:hypothetical protein
VILSVIPALFHPTYLLLSAVLVGTYGLGVYLDEKQLNRVIWLYLIAFILALPILAYVIYTFEPSSAEETARARDILVNFRIPHHAVIGEWLHGSAFIQILLVVAATLLSRRSRLFIVLVSCASAALILSLLQAVSGSDALALLFPWRISTLLVPLSTTVLLARLVEASFSRWGPWIGTHDRLWRFSGIALILLAVAGGGFYFYREYKDKAGSQERELYRFVAQHKQADDTYLIPIGMADFRLATSASVYVDFKSIPYQNREVIEWHRRVIQASDFYRKNRIDCVSLAKLSQVERISHLVMPGDKKEPDCKFLEEIFRNENYRLYRIDF